MALKKVGRTASINGKIKKRYDKIHLFSAKLPDGSLYDEKKYIESGKNISLHKFSLLI